MLVSPKHVLFYVADEAALRVLAATERVDIGQLKLIVGLKIEKKAVGDGTYTVKTIVARAKWMLLSNVRFIQHATKTDALAYVAADMDFFVREVASKHEDMQYFHADRLSTFLAGSMYNSGEYVTEYKGRGKAAGSGWLKLASPPANAHELLPHAPMPFTPVSLAFFNVGSSQPLLIVLRVQCSRAYACCLCPRSRVAPSPPAPSACGCRLACTAARARLSNKRRLQCPPCPLRPRRLLIAHAGRRR